MEKRILSSSGEELEISRVYKRKKEEEHENVDKISNLPDPLLHNIFSLLDMKQVVQTCILSRRWRYFWVSFPTLNFNYKRGNRYLETRNKSDFMDFVDRVLILRDSSNVQKLAVVVKECDISANRINTWILTSVIRNIQELSLQIYVGKGSWEFPYCLSNCESLTKLVLGPFGNRECTMVILQDLDSIILPRLKILSLEAIHFPEVNFPEEKPTEQFVSERCVPMLETLILIDFHFPDTRLNISSPKLKHLRLENCGMVRMDCNFRLGGTHLLDVHIDLPNLISFYYRGCMFQHCVLENLSSLVKADICMIETPMVYAREICDAQHTATILRGLHNLEELTLSLEFLKIATGAPELVGSHFMQFHQLKYLKLEGTELSIECIRVISYVLKTSPNIETLSLRMRRSSACNCQYCNETQSNSANEGDCCGTGLSLECLKCFEFRNVRACVNELKFIQILLNKAMVLEKLFIVFGFGESSSDEESCRVKFSEKVLTFPRASSSAVILFK